MYKTKQKTQLLDFFKNNTSKQFSINEIINEVCKNEGSGKSTVYRQIAKLVNDGEVLRLYGDDAKSVVYQYTGEGTKCDEHFHLKCTDCGRLIHNEDALYEDGEDYPYCRDCFEKLNNDAIKNYSYKPEPIFYGSGNLFYGVELEIDKGGEDSRRCDEIY